MSWVDSMKNILVLTIFSIAFVSMGVSATSAKEKSELIRISEELKYLKQEVRKVSELRRVDDSEAFNYEALFRDLTAVQEAVERHVSGSSRQPKSLKPLDADYGNIH